jgi:hypothetical protein
MGIQEHEGVAEKFGNERQPIAPERNLPSVLSEKSRVRDYGNFGVLFVLEFDSMPIVINAIERPWKCRVEAKGIRHVRGVGIHHLKNEPEALGAEYYGHIQREAERKVSPTRGRLGQPEAHGVLLPLCDDEGAITGKAMLGHRIGARPEADEARNGCTDDREQDRGAT